MPKIERRRATVTLYQGHYEPRLAELVEKIDKAEREEARGQQRNATKSKAMALAKEHDELVDEAAESAAKVTVWALSYLEFGPLQDRHPPRDDEPRDERSGVNMKTFPPALARCSLVEPGTAKDLDDLLVQGEVALRELGDLSHLHYTKLERAAWDVNVGDDALPKYSLVSMLKRRRDPDSKPQPDSE